MNIYKNKDILVTGCGSIGSEIIKQLLKYEPKRIRVFDNHEGSHFKLNCDIDSNKIRNLIGDVRDRERLSRAMDGVDIVFHTAANKYISFCEYNPFDAVYTNIIGTKNVLEAAIEKKVKYFITISSDKAVNPVNTMGATKLLAEKLTISAPIGTTKMKTACVRFGNVLNSDGSIIPLFKSQIEKNEPLTITSPEMTRFFMTISDAVEMILDVPKYMKSHPACYQGGDIFVLNNMKAFKIIDLAKVMALNYKHYKGKRIIGIRVGEKLHESLFSEEELPYVTKIDKFYVVRNPQAVKPRVRLYNTPYKSNEVKCMTQAEIYVLLKEKNIL